MRHKDNGGFAMSFINKRNLYGNEDNACALCEYQREVKLIKRLINISEKAVEQQTVESTESKEGICHSFAKTIIDYSKMAYDNVILGNFHAVKMINRSILENVVFLDIITNNDELWKYYLVYSYRNTIYKLNRIPTQNELDVLTMFIDMYINLYRMVTMYCSAFRISHCVFSLRSAGLYAGAFVMSPTFLSDISPVILPIYHAAR